MVTGQQNRLTPAFRKYLQGFKINGYTLLEQNDDDVKFYLRLKNDAIGRGSIPKLILIRFLVKTQPTYFALHKISQAI